MLQPVHALCKPFICPSANYCTGPALSSRVDARIYVSVSDRRVARAPHDWPNSYVCVTVGRSDMSK